MRKLILAAATILILTTSAQAGYRNHQRYGNPYVSRGGNNWVAPLVGGLILGGAIYGMTHQSYQEPRYYYDQVPNESECYRVFTGREYSTGYPTYQIVCQ